jgi:uncharacterized protein with HEPN domain
MTATLEDRLEHILDVIARVKRLTAGVTFGHFEQDGTLQWVERGLEIISEASRSIPESLKAEYADLGNRLRHAYHQVDSLIVWKIVTEDLGDLERVATLMKAGFEKDLPQ